MVGELTGAAEDLQETPGGFILQSCRTVNWVLRSRH